MSNEKIIHINDIKLPGEDEFSQRFNAISDHWQKAHDESLSEEERNEHLDIWFRQRQCLELGIN